MTRSFSRAMFAGAISFLAIADGALGQSAIWPTNGWPVSAPEEQGLDKEMLDNLDRRIRDGEFGYVDRMVVVRNGHLVVDETYTNDYGIISQGKDSPLGCGQDACPDEESAADPYNYLHPSTHPFYQGRDVHTLQSVTKSVTATLIGIAMYRGQIDGVEAPLLSFFEGYDISGTDARLARATLADLLTMRSGIEWHENDRPLDETNTTIQLERSDDWIQFTLDQPTDAEPGTKWAYNSGGSHLMSGVVKQATGDFVDAYAEKHLFGPLGIDDYHWKKTPKGYPDTEGGLYLEAEQLAKIGYLYLRNGIWEGDRLLDSTFVVAATMRQVESVNRAGWGYGYQWWRLDRQDIDVWAGLGFGGQFLLVLPEHDLIGVVNSWNLFGAPQSAILTAFLDTLVRSAAR